MEYPTSVTCQQEKPRNLKMSSQPQDEVEEKDSLPMKSWTETRNGVGAEEIYASTGTLEQLAEANGMCITQENGQRCYGPPKDWDGPPPGKGSEVFVGKLPRNMDEHVIIPVFSAIGPVYKIRLMMSFSGTNRGYCFVQYTCPEDADKAVRNLNSYEIKRGHRLGVLHSVDNRRLVLKRIPRDKTNEEILEEIRAQTEGVIRMIAYPSAKSKKKNCGFAFFEYESHKSAAMARRKMIRGSVTLWGRAIGVDWAEPFPSENILSLYVGRPPLTEAKLRQIFNGVSGRGVEGVRKFRSYAFVDFTTRDQADYARFALNNSVVNGIRLEVTWAMEPKCRAKKAEIMVNQCNEMSSALNDCDGGRFLDQYSSDDTSGTADYCCGGVPPYPPGFSSGPPAPPSSQSGRPNDQLVYLFNGFPPLMVPVTFFTRACQLTPVLFENH